MRKLHEPNISEVHCVAFSSLFASLASAITLVPALGGVVDGNAWLMLTICPLMIAWPASAYTFWQGEKLKSAHRDLARRMPSLPRRIGGWRRRRAATT